MDLNSTGSLSLSSGNSIDTQQTSNLDNNQATKSFHSLPASQIAISNNINDSLSPPTTVITSLIMPGLLAVGQAAVSQPSSSTQSDTVSHKPQSAISTKSGNHTGARGRLLQHISSESNLALHRREHFNGKQKKTAAVSDPELPELSPPSVQQSMRVVSSPSKFSSTLTPSFSSPQASIIAELSPSTSPSHHSRKHKYRPTHGSSSPGTIKSLLPRGFRKSGRRSKSTNISSSPSLSPSRYYLDPAFGEKACPLFDSNPNIGK